MLIEFRVQNHRSIGQEQSMTMEAMKRLGDDDDPRPRKVKGYEKQLLPVAALYGANASGKSNFLAAMGFMRDAVEHSFRTWSPDEGIEREPFAWGPLRTEPSLYEISMLIDDVRYEYGFVLNDEWILEEWLLAWPKKVKKRLFTRELDKIYCKGLSGDNKIIERSTRRNALFLSTAAQFDHPQLKPVLQWFRGFTMIRVGSNSNHNSRTISLTIALSLLMKADKQDKHRLLLMKSMGFDESMISQCKEMIEKADFGIHDIRVVDKEYLVDGEPKKMARLEFKHDSKDESSWLPFHEESSGTKSMIILSPLFFRALNHGDTVVVDELETALHPLLALEIIKSFNDPRTNPNHAQLIFSTHDTNLLDSILEKKPLRRDQIWLTEKKLTGQTEIFPHTDFHAINEENRERGYLLGRYGAVPFLHDLLSSDSEHDHVPDETTKKSVEKHQSHPSEKNVDPDHS